MSGPTEIRRIDLAQGPPGPASTVPGPAPATVTTASFVQPVGNATVSVTVASTAPWVAGNALLVEGAGDYVIDSITDATHFVLINLDTPGSLAPGNLVASGARVTTNGLPGAGTELAITTTDATPTPIVIDLSWLADGVAFRLDVVIVAKGPSSRKSFTLSGLFAKASGTITQDGGPEVPSGVLPSSGAPAWAGELAASGPNVNVMFTGAASTTIKVAALAQIVRVL